MSEYKSFFKRVGGNEGSLCHYSTRLDTYGCGCSHNCAYCYARSLLSFRGLWNPADPAVADIEKIRKKIKRELRAGEVVRLGGMTDCFAPIEKLYNVTYNTIEALNEARVHYLIVTKSHLVEDYIPIMDKDLAHIQISITSTDDRISRKIESGAPLPVWRIRAVEKLQKEGFDVQVRLSPFVPEFVDMDVINGIKCDKILVEFLRVNGWIRKWLAECGVSTDQYILKSGGYNHLPLYAKRAYLDMIKDKQISVCEDVPEHWEYWRKAVNANPEDCCNLKL